MKIQKNSTLLKRNTMKNFAVSVLLIILVVSPHGYASNQLYIKDSQLYGGSSGRNPLSVTCVAVRVVTALPAFLLIQLMSTPHDENCTPAKNSSCSTTSNPRNEVINPIGYKSNTVLVDPRPVLKAQPIESLQYSNLYVQMVMKAAKEFIFTEADGQFDPLHKLQSKIKAARLLFPEEMEKVCIDKAKYRV